MKKLALLLPAREIVLATALVYSLCPNLGAENRFFIDVQSLRSSSSDNVVAVFMDADQRPPGPWAAGVRNAAW